MPGHVTVLADHQRVRQFADLRRLSHLFREFSVSVDSNQIAWATCNADSAIFGFTWLGSGWVFDAYARKARHAELARRYEAMKKADHHGHQTELDRARGFMRFGVLSERLAWVIHQRVLSVRSSVVRIPDTWLAGYIWGWDAKRPSHWRSEISTLLSALAWLHVADRGGDNDPPSFGPETALLTHAADLRGFDDDACDEECPAVGGERHHHYLVNVGRGFLGILEQFGTANDAAGVRTYDFPVAGRKHLAGNQPAANLRAIGKTGRLVSMYLPSKLGQPTACDRLSTAQQRLLLAMLRETTRPRRTRSKGTGEPAATVSDARIPKAKGRGTVQCPLLDAQKKYSGFNGNSVRRGLGYYLSTSGGWLAKAGYDPQSDVPDFLDDVAALREELGVVPVGVRMIDGEFVSLESMQALAITEAGNRLLKRFQLRLFAEHGHLDRWNEFFGWVDSSPDQPALTADPSVPQIIACMKAEKLSQSAIAQAITVDASLLSKVLRGTKRMPQAWKTKLVKFFAEKSK